jgi:hypothetical protein
MKNLLSISGLLSVMLLLLSGTLTLIQWPGAGFFIVLSILSLLMFLGSFLWLAFKQQS